MFKLVVRRLIDSLTSDPSAEEVRRLNLCLTEARKVAEQLESQLRIEKSKRFELEMHADYVEGELEMTKLKLKNLSEIESGMDLYLYKTPENNGSNTH